MKLPPEIKPDPALQPVDDGPSGCLGAIEQGLFIIAVGFAGGVALLGAIAVIVNLLGYM